METYTRCHNCNDPISNFQIPRGRGGISIIWPKECDKYVTKLQDGNERILAIEINTNPKSTCLVNVYMPTKKINSDFECQVNLDILRSILDKYEETHTVIICGDMNGIILDDRNNSHDSKLNKFINENNLYIHPNMKSEQTFFHNDGKSSLQIDYIISNNDILETTNVLKENPINLSTHLPVTALT